MRHGKDGGKETEVPDDGPSRSDLERKEGVLIDDRDDRQDGRKGTRDKGNETRNRRELLLRKQIQIVIGARMSRRNPLWCYAYLTN